jgi:adenine-specific DNA-methyltransferase
VWKGKDDLDQADLEVEAPPIYIQEKIDPRVLVENLRRTAARPEDEPELQLFDTFDGLGELDLVDFYRHEANWSNRMILGDSLQVMASLAEREALRGKVQMIYVDPPYGIKFGSNWQVSARKRNVKDGKVEDASREVEQIKAFRDTWELGIHSYLAYLRDRLQVAKDLLTESGSIFVQIGDENVHLVRSLMDEVFGSENFRALIVVKKTAGLGSEGMPLVTDFILWYSKDRSQLKQRALFAAKVAADDPNYVFVEDDDGSRHRLKPGEHADQGSRVFRHQILLAAGRTESCIYPIEYRGKTYRPTAGSSWKTNQAGMARLIAAARVNEFGRSLAYIRFVGDFPVNPVASLWDDVAQGGFNDPKVYVVQTNTKVVQRCILMSTDPGDLVLDPTCGSGTTAYVAEQWGRRWITIDTSRVALALARQRLMGARFPYYLLADSAAGRDKEEKLTGTALPPVESSDDIRHGFVYERVQHITLRSIANNPDIRDGLSRQEIDTAIRRHADSEVLYDKPYQDLRRVRVTGPFTAESLSPHRSLAFAPSDEPVSIREAAVDPEAPTFEQTILANLATAGIQNGRRKERLTFEVVEPYAGTYVQALGIRSDAPDGAPARIGISIGPQYGTVGPPFVKQAAREAIRAGDIDLLCILGMAFDPTALGVTEELNATDEGFANVAAERQLGRVPVLLVRMNADLVMGEDLKKTGAGNLFTVFGEPDIDVNEVEGGELVVKIRGVDVYDPTTGDVRSNDTDQIALWMIDTNYNEESFFVRHCYFTGGQDPYARLKRALKADIDEDAWASLYQTESRPFPRPDTGKIAVKVINDYGDEVMKVFVL